MGVQRLGHFIADLIHHETVCWKQCKRRSYSFCYKVLCNVFVMFPVGESCLISQWEGMDCYAALYVINSIMAAISQQGGQEVPTNFTHEGIKPMSFHHDW